MSVLLRAAARSTTFAGTFPTECASLVRGQRLTSRPWNRYGGYAIGHRTIVTRSPAEKRRFRFRRSWSSIVVGTGILTYTLYPWGDSGQARQLATDQKRRRKYSAHEADSHKETTEASQSGSGAWFNFAGSFEGLSTGLSKVADVDWGTDKVLDYIIPDYFRLVPGYLRKLQRELSMSPGSLANEIWEEAHDPSTHPEIRYAAKVRVSTDLCEEEQVFREHRRMVTRVALARYLGLKEEDINPEDVPVIGMCGSGGGLRALVAGAGSMSAAADDGLFDCVTYTAGVSGSCWLQSLYYSSLTNCNLDKLINHLKARLGVHIAFPPAAFQALVSAPTNKSLLSGLVEKLKGDPNADFGLVDVYGILLAARLLVPKGELGVDDHNYKLSNQRKYIQSGANPMPIYTAVRHEIPGVDDGSPNEVPTATEEQKEQAKQEAWFQWFEISPYEFFCEEFEAGIPTWAMGRRFQDGKDVPLPGGFHLPEIRMPLLLGMFGSAFCATLSHYYREIRPLVQNLSGWIGFDELITGRNEDLSKVHPIDPTALPNPVYQMNGKLPKTTPQSVIHSEYIKLMDAGMSNNLPIYPLLRPGREVEIVIAFDASADIKTDNWLSVADGYARQRGIKGWPVGIGWPKETDPTEDTVKQLEDARAESQVEADQKLQLAQTEQSLAESEQSGENKDTAKGKDGQVKNKYERAAESLGYCTVWVGTTEERETEPPPPLKTAEETEKWRLMEPGAGIAVVYLPFVANDKVEGVDPATSDYMSTWNFVYTPEQVDKVVSLAKANYGEGRDQIKATVRAVYERKKMMREKREEQTRKEHYRRLVRLGIADKLGEGDHFS
ncbi:hypothetical protein MCOR25_000730 [Pyricularia grisea]|uniref:Lysophospholipase n=1 Tax=Pyricularia grisea TaxID=148305 RepID=A0A6P8BES5_PYRGI|nr:uncharacterized protein PgNI_03979 [Pyricularia grisea]KAI6382437.1 hypothetical protein MCOR25_000730 [Pyricularia grisea]TLD14290.1 hypothetical protein PgNI_03979 [Pyricularia grisea]